MNSPVAGVSVSCSFLLPAEGLVKTPRGESFTSASGKASGPSVCYGETLPTVKIDGLKRSKLKAARAKNRRVEFKLQ